MRIKKIYPFLILTVVMSLIITYGISEGKFKNYAFAEIMKPTLRELKYDIERSGVEHETTIVYNNNQYVDYEKVVQKGSDGMKKSVY